MATAESVKTKIQGLLATANEATGNSDTDLTTAVNALVAGFGTGGSGASGIYMAQITPASDTNYIAIEHNLNSDVLVAFLYVEDYTIVPTEAGRNFPVLQTYIKTNLDVYTSSSAFKNAYMSGGTYNYSNNNVGRSSGFTSNSYTPSQVDLNTFSFQTANTATARFIAGQTLNVVVIATNVEV